MKWFQTKIFDVVFIFTWLLLLGLNIWQFTYKPDTTFEDKKIEKNNTEILYNQNLLNELYCKIDSIKALKRRPIYIFKYTSKKRDEKINQYYNASDSIRIYTGTKRTIYFRISK